MSYRTILAILAAALVVAVPASAAPPTDVYGDPLPEGVRFRIGSLRLFHTEPVFAVAFAPDGKTVAAAGLDVIHVWDVAAGKELRRFGGKEQEIFALAFAPDGKLLVSAGPRVETCLWD